jgi:hypothetical protein
LTVSAVVWSGNQLTIVPYGDAALSANGALWNPNLTWQYSLGDGDFLPWDGDTGGGSDPVLLERRDPAQAANWLSLEYLDSANSYNPQIVPVFDQGLIDACGLRSAPPVQGHCFTNPTGATVSASLLLQRRAYVRNTYRFKLGIRYALLEPMDILLLSDAALASTPHRCASPPWKRTTTANCPSPPKKSPASHPETAFVIPGLGAAESPEPIFQRLVFMGSGLAAARRPGMTKWVACILSRSAHFRHSGARLSREPGTHIPEACVHGFRARRRPAPRNDQSGPHVSSGRLVRLVSSWWWNKSVN